MSTRHTLLSGWRGWPDRATDLLAVGRPMFWPVSLSPFLLGLTLATGEIFPPREHWARAAVAGLVIGPLIWFTVLAVNDAYDVEGDRLNARKSRTPLTRGRLTPHIVLTISRWAGVVSVLAALLVGVQFALGTAAVVVLG